MLALFAAIVSAVFVLVPQQQAAIAASPVGAHGNRIVSDSSPVSWTPHVDDGYVQAMAEVGNLVLAGGNFSTVENPSRTQQYTRNYIFAFEKGTGVISPTFVPDLNGEVFSIVPTGDGQTVWIAGGFNTVNGQTYRGVVKLNVSTGQVVTQFRTPSFNGRIHDVHLRGDRLYVTGRFTTIDGAAAPARCRARPGVRRSDSRCQDRHCRAATEPAGQHSVDRYFGRLTRWHQDGRSRATSPRSTVCVDTRSECST